MTDISWSFLRLSYTQIIDAHPSASCQSMTSEVILNVQRVKRSTADKMLDTPGDIYLDVEHCICTSFSS